MTVTLVVHVLVPPAPLTERTKLVVPTVVSVTFFEPFTGTVEPSGVSVALVAFVLVHVIVDVPPTIIVDGLALIVQLGAGVGGGGGGLEEFDA